MKRLFELQESNIYMFDAERMIFELQGNRYCDIHGNALAPEFVFGESYHSLSDFEENDTDDLWDPEQYSFLAEEGTIEPLRSESTTEIQWEIDDRFGNFGFINKSGEFVIEPQYAFAFDFSCGLAAVNLKRTWYKTENGARYYENHFGYINERGQTVIPFAYDEAWPFNKYGVAVVADLKRSYLIDTEGKEIPGTEELEMDSHYDYKYRFFEFSYRSDTNERERKIGVYDTKKRRIVLPPIASHISHHFRLFEDFFIASVAVKTDSVWKYEDRYYNADGELLYPWLYGKGFSTIGTPNDSLLTVVAIPEPIELSKDDQRGISYAGKKYLLNQKYGVLSSTSEFIISPEYDAISELTQNIYALHKRNNIEVVQIEPSDF